MNLLATHGGYCEAKDALVYIDAALESGPEYLKYNFFEDERTNSPFKNITAAYTYLKKAKLT